MAGFPHDRGSYRPNSGLPGRPSASAVEAEIAAGEYGKGTERLTEVTESIEPNLEWELMPGHTATHALCISAAADTATPPPNRIVARPGAGF